MTLRHVTGTAGRRTHERGSAGRAPGIVQGGSRAEAELTLVMSPSEESACLPTREFACAVESGLPESLFAGWSGFTGTVTARNWIPDFFNQPGAQNPCFPWVDAHNVCRILWRIGHGCSQIRNEVTGSPSNHEVILCLDLYCQTCRWISQFKRHIQ